ncbi:hypothetical protein RJ639_013294 [Escallonia herrerae]|uniref:MADS-box domain-containing protein n=1 Tax=Escallonia herrerae TaxID=1293975 RepID=A0AA88VMF5_9ASTE|nr:hypothetical protein RJ639_013294 [Escallonia herrerae]
MEEGKKRKRWHEEKAMDLKMKASYVRRKACIKKKAMELSTLCDVKAFSICLSPAGDFETCPENPNEVHAIVNMYRDKKKLEAGKSLKEMADDGGFLNGSSQESLHDLYTQIEVKIKVVEERIAFLNRKSVNQDQSMVLTSNEEGGYRQQRAESFRCKLVKEVLHRFTTKSLQSCYKFWS